MLPARIPTTRLLLRTPRLDDAQAIFDRYAQDPEVTRYLVWRPHSSVSETRHFLEERLKAWTEGTHSSWMTWIITRDPDDTALGMIDLRPTGHMADVGYVLARPEWGKGYTTEALKAVIATAFALPEIYRVWAICDIDNLASARVMEKAGMLKEGVLKRYIIHPNISPEPRDACLYAIAR